MKKKVLKIAALIIAIVLIVGVFIFANALVGNPISKAVATNTAEKHLEENYADKDFEIDRVTFSFKDGYYHAFVYSPSSIDSEFALVIDMWGNLRSDSYIDRVLSGWNTAERVSRDYRAAVDKVLDSQAFPYNEHIGYGDFDFYPREHLEEYSVSEYALITEDLTLDAFYDVNELGAKHGKLTIYIDVDHQTGGCPVEAMDGIKFIGIGYAPAAEFLGDGAGAFALGEHPAGFIDDDEVVVEMENIDHGIIKLRLESIQFIIYWNTENCKVEKMSEGHFFNFIAYAAGAQRDSVAVPL